MLDSSLFPSSRHHGPLLLQSSGPARRSRTGFRYFLFYPATPLPVCLSALQSFSSSSCRPSGFPSLQSSFCKCVCRRWLPRCTPLAAILVHWTQQEKLFWGSEGLDSLLTISFLLPLLSIFFTVLVPLLLSPRRFRTAGSDRVLTVSLWLSLLNRCLVLDSQGRGQASLVSFSPSRVGQGCWLLLCSGQSESSC